MEALHGKLLQRGGAFPGWDADVDVENFPGGTADKISPPSVKGADPAVFLFDGFAV